MKIAPASTLRIVLASWRIIGARNQLRLVLLTLGRVWVNAFDLLGVFFLGLAVALISGSEGSLSIDALIPAFLSNSPETLLVTTASLFLAKAVLGAFLARRTAFFLARIEASVVERAIRSVYSTPITRFSNISRPALEWSIMRSATVALSVVLMQASTLIADLSLAIALFSIMLASDWGITLGIGVFLLILIVIFQSASGNHLKKAGEDMRGATLDSSRGLADITSTFREMSITGKIEEFLEDLSRARNRLALSNARYSFLQSLPKTILETAAVVGLVLFLLMIVLYFPGSSLSLSLGLIIVASLRLLSTALPVTRSISELRFLGPQAIAAQDLVSGTSSETQTQAGKTRFLGVEPPRIRTTQAATVEVREVEFSYSIGALALHQVSFSLSAGESCAIVGASGSGKSTLLELLVGLLTPSSGSLMIDNSPAHELIQEFPGSIGFVPQQVGLISGSLDENVRLSRHLGISDSEAMWQAIVSAGLSNFVSELPSGLATDLGEHADQLSGGEKQRIGIARALLGSPRLLVLDEATSALDALTESEVLKNLLERRNEFTLLVTAHRISPLKYFDKIVVLDQGKLVACGSYKELRQKSKVFSEFVSLMSTE